MLAASVSTGRADSPREPVPVACSAGCSSRISAALRAVRHSILGSWSAARRGPRESVVASDHDELAGSAFRAAVGVLLRSSVSGQECSVGSHQSLREPQGRRGVAGRLRRRSRGEVDRSGNHLPSGRREGRVIVTVTNYVVVVDLSATRSESAGPDGGVGERLGCAVVGGVIECSYRRGLRPDQFVEVVGVLAVAVDAAVGGEVVHTREVAKCPAAITDQV